MATTTYKTTTVTNDPVVVTERDSDSKKLLAALIGVALVLALAYIAYVWYTGQSVADINPPMVQNSAPASNSGAATDAAQ